MRDSLERGAADNLAASLSYDGITIEVVPSSAPDTPGFRVVLTGYSPGSRGRLRAALMRMSRKSDEEVIGFLARIPFALRRNADAETAASVRRMIEAAGGLVEVRPEGAPAARQEQAAQPRPSPARPVKEVREASPKPAPGAEPRPSTEVPVMMTPPVVRSSEARQVFTEPQQYTAMPPEASLKLPSVLLPEHAATFPAPFAVSFAPPARLSPLPAQNGVRIPEAARSSYFPVYLCPVQEKHRHRTERILSDRLGISGEKARDAVMNAPSVISLEKSPAESSARVHELSGLGLPVTLVKPQEGVVKNKDHVWFGNWLRPR